jgi:hypothetical protein
MRKFVLNKLPLLLSLLLVLDCAFSFLLFVLLSIRLVTNLCFLTLILPSNSPACLDEKDGSDDEAFEQEPNVLVKSGKA